MKVLASVWNRSGPLTRAAGALVLMVIIGCVFNGDGAFFRWSTHRGVLREVSVPGLLACGMTVVVLSGGIDLSVGSVLSLGAVVFSLLTMQLGVGVGAALVMTVGVGGLVGLVSGSLVSRLAMQPFIATLSTMVFARGLSKLLSGGKKVTNLIEGPGGATTVAHPWLFDALDGHVAGGAVPVVTVVWLGAMGLVWALLGRTRLGLHVRAVGDSERAARLSGVRVEWVQVAAYAISGLLAAVASLCQAAQETHGDPETGAGYELTAIAMVVLGGTPLSGGRGGVLLTVLGVLSLGYLEKILSINAYRTETRLMLTGVIITLAVLLQRREKR